MSDLPPIPITRPSFDARELDALRDPITTGWVAQGPAVRRFEAAVAEFTGAAFAVACTSATAALHMGLVALGVGPGDEVIVPAFTWIATANAALYCGATPVFCDIDLATFNLDPDDLLRRLTPRTRAVVPVHLFGRPAALPDLSHRPDVRVLEDAACALGTLTGEAHVGLDGQLGVFSFHPRKILTTGEGGMLIGADPALEAPLRSLRDHGASLDASARHRQDGAPPQVVFDALGFNYRMTDLQGAIGHVQMSKLPELLARRDALARRYNAALAEVPWLHTPSLPAGGRHSWQAYVCMFRPEAPTLANVDGLHALRGRLMAHLAERGIGTRPGTHAVHAQGLYRRRLGLTPGDLPQAWMADRLSLALPLYPQLTEADQDRVVEEVKQWGAICLGVR